MQKLGCFRLFLGRYNPSENLRGPEKVAKRLFENISSKNPETVFIEYFFDGREYNYIKKIFGSEKIIAGKKIIFRLGLVRLFVFLLKEKPNIIHLVTFERFAFIGFIYKVFVKVKIVYTVHGIICYENNFLKENLSPFYKIKDKYFERLVFKYSDKIIFLSDISLKFAEKYLSITKSKVEVIPNGVDKCFYEVKRMKDKNENSPLKIVFVGDYFRKEKGFDFLIDSLKDVQFPVKLYVISKYTNKYDSFSNKNLKIEFIDKLEQKKYAEFLGDKDIIISSSYYDNFSISIVEGMAAGLVPVVTKETGMSELIEDGVNGFVFSYKDAKRLFEIINEIYFNNNILLEVKQKSRQIYKNISWDLISGKYLKSY
ncbi:MAG: glycosyltransferase family 4 protein [Ignavibacteriaceae bacterium]